MAPSQGERLSALQNDVTHLWLHSRETAEALKSLARNTATSMETLSSNIQEASKQTQELRATVQRYLHGVILLGSAALMQLAGPTTAKASGTLLRNGLDVLFKAL